MDSQFFSNVSHLRCSKKMASQITTIQSDLIEY